MPLFKSSFENDSPPVTHGTKLAWPPYVFIQLRQTRAKSLKPISFSLNTTNKILVCKAAQATCARLLTLKGCLTHGVNSGSGSGSHTLCVSRQVHMS